MKHPDEQINIAQRDFLSNLSPEKKDHHARLFRIGNASVHYHRRAKSFNPTRADWEEWVSGLPDPARSKFRADGFEKCRGVLSFTRYVNEVNDIGMDKFMKENLSEEDYQYYFKQGK